MRTEPGSYLLAPQLCLLCKGKSGSLFSFGLNLRDTFSAVRDSGKLAVVRGHSGACVARAFEACADVEWVGWLHFGVGP